MALVLTTATACAGEVRRIPSARADPLEAVSSREPESRADAPTGAPTPSSPPCDVASSHAEALGVVEAPYVYGKEDASRAELRARALKMGADAVIDVRRATSGNDEHLLGTAVRCRALTEERPYDVVGQIDVPGVEGGPEAAFTKLRERARDLHADLVVDVHLAQDDADHAHVTGVAIRYR
jgi:uncharacterized protein YbjQ (UPF0145 family)